MDINRRLIVLVREELANLKWAIKARAKENYRPKLKGFQIVGDRLVCVDGFRAHSIPLPANMKSENDTVIYPLTGIASYMGVEQNGDQPIALNDLQTKVEQQVFQFAVTGQYLIDALAMSKISIIRIFANKEGKANLAVVEPISEDGDRIAFVMLATGGNHKPKSYQLVKQNVEEAKLPE